MAIPPTRRLLAITYGLAALSIGATTAPVDRGKLLIIGGGMTAEMAPIVYGVLADQLPANATIGDLPTASSEKFTPGPETTGRLATNLKGRKLTTLNIPSTANGDDPALAKQIDGCDAVFFGGGAQSAILKAFHPNGRDTLIAKAVDNLLARDGLVAGTSAGAECMTDPMIEMGTSDRALADPMSLPIVKGMGYFKFGLVDQHFLQRGRFGRLVVALERTNKPFGFGISEARAMLVDRATGHMTVIGHDGVVFINRTNATGRENIRINVLCDGDTIDGHTGTVTTRRLRRDTGPRSGAEPDLADAWAKLALDKLFHSLVDSTHATATALDPHAAFRFTVDDKTKLYANPADPKDVTIVNLTMGSW